MKGEKETLLGFDAREWYREFDRCWDQKRRETYLLKQDGGKVISTDTSVWPSVFDIGDSRLGYLPEEDVNLLDPPRPTHAVQDMWDHLSDLQRRLVKLEKDKRNPCRVVVISLITSPANDQELESWHSVAPSTQTRFPARCTWTVLKGIGRPDLWKHVPSAHESGWLGRIFWKKLPRFGPDDIAPSVRSAEWEFLGYDVSDGFLLSGLSNCGYKADEVEQLKRDFGRHLNQYHLFDDLEAARRFRDIRSDQVREHAPFFVYGIQSVGVY